MVKKPSRPVRTAHSDRPEFTGKERDSETGLDYFGARYYSAAQGRFTSPDEPLVDQWADDAQTWNLYSYARSNPLRLIDPTGNAACEYDDGSDPWSDKDGATAEACASEGGTWAYQPTDFNVPGWDASAFQFTATTSVDTGDLNADGQALVNQPVWSAANTAMNYIGGALSVVTVGGFAGMGSVAIAGGSGLTTLAIPAATLPPLVSNPTLQDIANKLFQLTDRLPGGTAGVVKWERLNGEPWSPSFHFQKAEQAITRLTDLLKSGKLSYNDQLVARELIESLSKALQTTPGYWKR